MDIAKALNQLGVAAAMLQQVAAGQVSFNQGTQPVEDREAIEVLAHVMLCHVDELIARVHDDSAN